MVAIEVGEPVDRIDTAVDAGQAELCEVSPFRKVPVAVIDGRTLFDSRAIIDYLTTVHGWGELAPPRDQWRDANLVNAIDAALDSVIQLFYLRRDGVAVDGTPYNSRQMERADAIFDWLGKQVVGASFSTGFGVPELSLVCALDWMDFRKTYPTEKLTAFAAVRGVWHERPAMVATRPQV